MWMTLLSGGFSQNPKLFTLSEEEKNAIEKKTSIEDYHTKIRTVTHRGKTRRVYTCTREIRMKHNHNKKIEKITSPKDRRNYQKGEDLIGEQPVNSLCIS